MNSPPGAPEVRADAGHVAEALRAGLEPKPAKPRQNVYLVAFAAVLASTAVEAELPLRTLEGVSKPSEHTTHQEPTTTTHAALVFFHGLIPK